MCQFLLLAGKTENSVVDIAIIQGTALFTLIGQTEVGLLIVLPSFTALLLFPKKKIIKNKTILT